MNRRTIAKINKELDETGSVLAKKPPGRPVSARTRENGDRILQQLQTNSLQPISTRRLSGIMQIKRTSLQRILKDVGARPYAPV